MLDVCQTTMNLLDITDRGLRRFEDVTTLPGEGIYYLMKHDCILRKDTQPFLEFFDVERIAKAGRLPSLFRKVCFALGGFDDDERALHEIPEARVFLKELAADWPYFFYVDALGDYFLTELIKCLVPTITTMNTGPD